MPPKTGTSSSAIAWSVDLLDDDERRLFNRLSVFAGGFTIPAAAGVLAQIEPDAAPEIIETAVVSLVDRDRQWFKSNFGLDACETSRDVSFCGHTILERRFLVVPDALKDERFRDNPLVSGPPWIRFYAGAILRLPYGPAVGALCLMDRRPREIDPIGLSILGSLRDLVVEEMVRKELVA